MGLSVSSKGVLGPQVCEYRVDAIFGDGADSGRSHAQAYPAIFALDPETLVLHVGHKTAFRLVVGVGDIVPHHGAFPRDLAYTRHDVSFTKFCLAGISAKTEIL